MPTSLDTRIRRMVGTLVAVTVIALVAAGSALAGGRPAASYYTKQQLEAMSERWAAKGRYTPEQLKALRAKSDAAGLKLRRQLAPAASFYTPQQLQAMSERWAAKGRYTPEQLRALRAKWDAAGTLLASQNVGVSAQAGGSGFHWGDFGIGAGAGIGLLLLMSGLAVATYYGRRGHHQSGSTA